MDIIGTFMFVEAPTLTTPTNVVMAAADAAGVSDKARQAAEDAEKDECPICMGDLPDVERGVLACVSVPTLLFQASARRTPDTCTVYRYFVAVARVGCLFVHYVVSLSHGIHSSSCGCVLPIEPQNHVLP